MNRILTTVEGNRSAQVAQQLLFETKGACISIASLELPLYTVYMNAINVQNITKKFPGETKALDGLSFAINEGEVFGFLGPNGSGKTTTVKLLNGVLAPTEEPLFDYSYCAASRCAVYGASAFKCLDTPCGRAHVYSYCFCYGKEILCRVYL